MTVHEADAQPPEAHSSGDVAPGYASFAAWLAKHDRLAVENARKITGADISHHNPDDLRIIDTYLDRDFRDEVRRRKESISAAIVYGSYLGEVMIRHLNARWRYPSRAQALIGVIFRRRRGGEKYCYVVLGDEKVYVFRAAREAIEKTADAFSLYEFYRQHASRIPRAPSE